MLERLYISSKTISGSLSDYETMFIRDWDAMFVRMGTYYHKVFRDGTSIRMGGAPSNSIYIPNNDGRVLFYSALDKKLYKTDPFTALPIYTQPVTITTAFTLYAGDFIDEELKLIFHKASGGFYVDIYDLVTGAFIRRTQIGYSTSIVDGYYSYNYAGQGRICAVGKNGYVTIYDYISDVIVQKSQMGTTLKVGTYDCNYYVLLAINNSNKTLVYSLTDLGTGLSAPVFIPSGNKYLYSGYIVQTRFIGTSGAPMAGKWINWELLGDKGYLEKTHSITDEQGYAYNFFWTPTGITGLGSETIRVWCEI